MNWGMKAQERQKGTEGTFVCDPQETGICRSPASHLVLWHQSATNTSPLTGSMQASLPQLDMTQSAGKAHAAGSCSCYRQPYSCQQEWTQPIRTAHTLFNKKKKKISIDKWNARCSCHAESTKATGAELQLYSSGNGSKVAAQLYLARKLKLCKPCILGSRKPWQALVPAETFEQLHPCWCRSFSRQVVGITHSISFRKKRKRKFKRKFNWLINCRFCCKINGARN